MELLQLLPSVTGVREMWLLVMGGVLMLAGGVRLLQVAWAWFAPRLVLPMLAVLPRREEARERALPAGRRSAV